jgi:hypothetical protein
MEWKPIDTVIIVHGTWAAPEEGKKRWYQFVEGVQVGSFTAKLDAALQSRGSSARCWAHCIQGDDIFYWSGDNSWIARTQAAAALSDYVAELRNYGYRCHIVAHSHGGNVLLEALPEITSGRSSTVPLGNFVTLGAPFIDVISPILQRDSRRQMSLLRLFLLVLLTPLIFLLAGSVEIKNDTSSIASLIGIAGCIVVFILIVRRLFRAHQKINWKYATFEVSFLLGGAIVLTSIIFTTSIYVAILSIAVLASGFLIVARLCRDDQSISPSSLREMAQKQIRFLALGSHMDEAWQLLHHMRTCHNPLAVRSNVFAYLFLTFRSSFVQKRAVDRINYGQVRDPIPIFAAGIVYFIVPFAVLGVITRDWFVPCVDDTGHFALCSTLSTAPDFFRGDTNAVLGRMLLLVVSVVSFIFIPTVFFENKFRAAVSWPLRWCTRALSSLASIFGGLVTYIVRHASWSVLLKLALGLEGYRFEVPIIEQCPSNINAKYENMPTGAETRALRRRSEWIGAEIENVSTMFSKMVITKGDISSLLRAIEADQTLVHAAYYTDDECIARIADWIAEV